MNEHVAYIAIIGFTIGLSVMGTIGCVIHNEKMVNAAIVFLIQMFGIIGIGGIMYVASRIDHSRCILCQSPPDKWVFAGKRKIRKNLECPISLTKINRHNKIYICPNDHIIKYNHMREWMKKSETCPVCRADINEKKYYLAC